MAATTEKASPTVELQLTRDAVIALLKEARQQFGNGAHELYSCEDVGQRSTIAACTEIIGRLDHMIERPWNWPTKEIPRYGKEELGSVTVEFSRETAAWLKWDRDQQRPYVELELATGASVGEPGYEVEQVYLLHVLERVVRQVEGQVA